MKRIYFKKNKTQKREEIEKEALKRLREVRAKVKEENPGLLSAIRARYERMQGSGQSGASNSDPFPKKLSRKAADNSPEDTVPIDREKNMETVAKFLQMTDSKRIREALLKGQD